MTKVLIELLSNGLKDAKEKGGECINKLIKNMNEESAKDVLSNLLETIEKGKNLSEEDNKLVGVILDICNFIYNNTGESTGLSDSEYDELVEYYRDQTGNDIIGTDVVSEDVAHHKYTSLRGTLDKIYKLTEEDVVKNKSQKTIEDWVNTSQRRIKERTGATVNLWEEDIFAFPKFDGVSCIFECDKDGNLERALTRGNTTTNEAQDITKILKGVFKDPITGAHGPHGLKTEIMMKNDDLEEYNKKYHKNYKNTRSIVSSILNSDEADERVNYLQIIPLRYSYYSETDQKEGDQMLAPGAFEFSYISCKLKELDLLHEFAFSHGAVYPGLRCDGMVIYIKDQTIQKMLGRENNRQKFEVAFKFTEEVAYSKVQDIEFTTGLFGTLNPVVRFKPVKMKGNKIEKASLGSYARFKDLELSKGDKIKILYDIIPYVQYDDSDPNCKRSNKEVIEAPIVCPDCGCALEENEDQTILRCSNPKCPCRVQGKILNFLNKMDIGEISYATVKDFYEAGYLKSIPDIYKIENNVKSLSKLPGYGANKINKIINEIEKHRVVLPSVLLGSLGIEGVSIKTFKSILQYFSMDEILNLSKSEAIEAFTVIPGIREKTAAKIVNGINENSEIISILEDELDILDEKKESGDFTVVFTKVPRTEEYKKLIKDAGGVLEESLTKNSDLLVIPMEGITSSKITKANKYGIPIVTIDKLEEYLNDHYN